jgi:simple sugar transport system permease protein
MLSGAFGSINGLAETLVKATPLLLASLGVSVAFRSRLFNVGAEGQLYIGALAATLVAFRTGGLAPGLAIALVILAGALGGGAWGLIPGYLKARHGLDEIIVTIMLNYVATLLISFLVRNNLRDPSGYLPHSAPLPSATVLPVIVAGTRLHAGLFIALAAALLVFILLWRTRVGYELRMVGTGPEAARAAGINVALTTVVAMTISGALAGLAGMSEVAGVHHRLLEDISPGYGFTAIAIALLGGNSPLGITLASFLFAGLDVGSSAMQTRVGVPVHVVTVIQGAIILLVVGREAFGRLRRFGARSSQGKA